MGQIIIDTDRRYALMRAHTATHLLHAALSEIFPQTKQAGSYVGEDELRFDFFAERLLDAKEIEHINNQINTIIRQHHLVTVTEMSYQDAIASGAKAFFEDKYPERVRVVKIHETQSVELCGGTHVSQTNEIGAFFIIEQSAVAAGVKRIVALTGPRVAGLVQSLMTEKNLLADKVGVPAKQVEVKIDKLIAESKDVESKYNNLFIGIVKDKSKDFNKGSLGNQNIDKIKNTDGDTIFAQEISKLIEIMKSSEVSSSWLVYNNSGQYALFHPQAKDITRNLGLKGGGSENFVQGRDEKIIQFIQ